MNIIPVLKSKLTMPDLSENFLFTDRIKKLHTDMDSCHGVTVYAPAGYGKTSLAVSYFKYKQESPIRVCWYRVEQEDINFSIFITHLLESIFPTDLIEFAETRKSLNDFAKEHLPHQFIAILCQEMWALHSKADNIATYIVLDDYQNIAQSQDIVDATRFLFDNLPPSYSIFLLSRVNLEVFTEKQKLEKSILELNINNLSFTKSEIEKLILKMNITAKGNNISDYIEKNTEGWIAGIIILCQAINQNVSCAELIHLHRKDALFRYLSAEVFKTIPLDIQDTLAKLALLEDFSGVEAQDILGIDHLEQLLEQEMEFSMFIQRISGNPVVYRFHSLFKEYLLSALNTRSSEEWVSELHLKAARYYISQSMPLRAADHLAKCNDLTAALNMLLEGGFNRLMIGETMQLKIFLDWLPQELVINSPVLFMYKMQMMSNSKQLTMLEPLKKIKKDSLTENNLDLYFGASFLLFYLFICYNDMNGIIETASNIPKLSPDAANELKNTVAIIEMVKSISEDQFSKAELQSENIRYSILPDDLQHLYLCYSGIIYYCLGKLDKAEFCMNVALDLGDSKSVEPARAYILHFQAIILSLKHEKERLPALTSEIIEIAKKYEIEYLVAYGKRLAAFERYLSFEVQISGDLLNSAVFCFNNMGNKIMAASCRLLQCLWTLHFDNLSLNEAQTDLMTIQNSNPGMMVYETSLSIFGAIAREAGQYELAEQSLLSSIKSSQAKKSLQVLCGSYFHIARLYFTSGKIEQGHHYLRLAMELAEKNRYFMFWDIHIPTLVDMLLHSIKYDYCLIFAQEMLGKFFEDDTAKYLAERAKTIADIQITNFANNFVADYKPGAGSQPYFLKACLFGKPEFWVNGVKISNTEWKTKKVKGLLELLLFNSGRTISKDSLAATLWPESDNNSAIVSLRTALYQLRKLLTKFNIEVSGENALVYETLEGLEIRKSDALYIDKNEFLELKSQLKTATTKKEDILQRMITLYVGDLMENCNYEDSVLFEREKYKLLFEEACLDLSSIYICQGKFFQAEEILRNALAYDPYNENVCFELLKLFMSQGMRSKALTLYNSYKKCLENELQIEVDKRLTEVVKL